MPLYEPRLNISEVDGSPSTYPYQLQVPNGSLTDNGDGTVTLAFVGSAIDHGTLTGLADDDHTQYALLVGRGSSQILRGATTSGGFLQLISTAHATKGLIYFGGASGMNIFVYEESTNRIGLGTVAPDADVTVEKNGAPLFFIKAFGDSAGIRPGYVSARARGTSSAATAVQAGDFLGEFTFRGHNGTQIVGTTSAGFRCRASENWTTIANGSEFDFTTTPNGGTSPIVRMVLTSEGDFGFGNFVAADVAARLHAQDSVVGPVAIIENMVDSSSVQSMRFIGNQRLTAANGDEAFHTFFLDDADENPAEYARLNWVADDITSASKDGAFEFEVMVNNTLTRQFRVDAGRVLVDNKLEVDGVFDHDGSTVGFYNVTPVARSAAYTPTNVTTDRSFDANASSLDEIADSLGTLISDLQALGLIG